MSSDSILVVLGIVSPVESAFGGCLSCSCSECIDAISSWSITVLYPSADCFRSPDLAMITANWSHCCFDHAGPWCGFSTTSPWIHGWDLLVGRGLRYSFPPSVNSLSEVSALLYYTFDLFIFSAMFSCTTLEHASFGMSGLVAVGMSWGFQDIKRSAGE